ncbi:type II secretion system F family protein [Dactylosporangium sp. AC04546]|uniref:type II secretion system F family protein n=1 Tax=Dactylosporangium sp. AC04546 TaxID=2862460 RepID=UPI001EDEC6AA|nr:type II secretion system F family protein [Dactylosporangium sp. AC04546]WVK80412.1 type II secretion system F family protein [Dactylosporangium sp. AC04546]
MSPAFAAAVICSGLVGSVALAISAVVGPERTERPPSRARWLWSGAGSNTRDRRRHRMWLVASVAAGALAWIVSGVPIVAPLVAIAVPGIPWLLSAGKEEQRGAVRVEAVEAWTRRLRDIEESGVGLQEAIVETAQAPPAAITAEVQLLAARIQAGWDAEAALYEFADALQDPVSDQVVVALALHLSDRGTRLSDALTGIAEAAADEVAMRREVTSKRARARFQIQFLTVGSVVLVGVGIASRQYTAPYAEPRGQLVLALLACAFVGCLWWARSLSLPPADARFLSTTRNPS